MKTLILFITIILTTLTSHSQIPLSGKWNTGSDNTIIEIYHKSDGYYGKIISSENREAKIGTDILQGFTYRNNRWQGKVFGPRRNQLMDATIEIKGDTMILKVGSGIMSRTLEWKKE